MPNRLYFITTQWLYIIPSQLLSSSLPSVHCILNRYSFVWKRHLLVLRAQNTVTYFPAFFYLTDPLMQSPFILSFLIPLVIHLTVSFLPHPFYFLEPMLLATSQVNVTLLVSVTAIITIRMYSISCHPALRPHWIPIYFCPHSTILSAFVPKHVGVLSLTNTISSRK